MKFKPIYDKHGIKLYCGDALLVMQQFKLACFDVVLTDPPYGARRPPQTRVRKKIHKEVVGNDAVYGEFLKCTHALVSECGALYMFCVWNVLQQWIDKTNEAGWRVRSCIVWDKVRQGLADPETCWAPTHEMILFAAKGRHIVQGKRPSDVIRCNRVLNHKIGHPYQKPVALLAKIIQHTAGVIFDPYAGSGSTLIAAKQLGREAVGIEIDEQIARNAARRLEACTSRTFSARK